MELTADNVNALIKKCLFDASEVPGGMDQETSREWAEKNARVGKGIMQACCFHPGRIAESRPDIQSMLEQLPDEFRSDEGGGWSFLNLCMRKDGVHWAEHPTMDALCCLAEGAGLGKYLDGIPREILPGGMPYFSWKPIASEAVTV